jgi:hypothetical protein
MSSLALGSADAEAEIQLPPSPYPGLRPFEKDEWPIFFGRETMTHQVIDRLASHQLVVVHGDSGCGKSSLVRAGVLAQLEQAQARGGNRWRTCAVLPRRDPLGNLANALAELDGRKGNEARILELRRILNFGREAPAALAVALHCEEHDQICLVIDQFEELFSFARSDGLTEARLLVDVLVSLVEKPPAGLYALLTMRSEFLGSCARFRGFAEAVNATQYLLPQMDQAALLRAIRDPALLYEGEVSRDLAERLIADTGGGQDQLPLIQHGLMLIYHRKLSRSKRDDRASPGEPDPDRRWRLTSVDYLSGPDLASLLSDHADSVMAVAARRPGSQDIDPKREQIVEDLFRALTDTNAEGQAIRRPQTVEQLVAVSGGDAAPVRSILDDFRAEGVSFLTPYGNGPLGDAELVDISHEALIRHWKRIANPAEGWLDREFRDGLIWKGLLTRGDVLGQGETREIERWLDRRNEVWSRRYGSQWDKVESLVKASRQAADRQARRDRLFMRTIATVAVLATVLAVAVGYFWWNSTIQLRRANLALAQGISNTFASINSDELSADELNSLWSLTADAAVRAAFVEQLKTNRGDAVRFGLGPETVGRALGLDWPSSAVTDSLLAAVVSDMSQMTDPDAFRALAHALQALPAKLSDTQAQAAIESVLAAIKSTTNPYDLRTLAEALQALPAKLSDKQAQAAIEPILTAIKNQPQDEFHSYTIANLAEALQALPAKLSDTQAQAAIEPVFAAIKAPQDSFVIYELARALPARLSDTQAQAAIEAVLAAMKANVAMYAFLDLGQSLQTLAAKLSDTQAQAAIEPVFTAFTGRTSPYAVYPLGVGYRALAAKLSATHAQAAIEHVVTAIKSTNNPYALDTLVQAYQALAPKLSNTQAQAAVEPVLNAIKSTTDPDTFHALAQALQALPAKLSDTQAQAALEPVLAAINGTTDPHARAALARALPALVSKLSVVQARAAIKPILAAINGTTDPHARAALAQALLATKLSDMQARAAIETILAAIKGTTDPDDLQALAQALPARLSDAQAQAAIEPVLAAIKAPNSRNTVTLAQAFQALAPKLSDRQKELAIVWARRALGWAPGKKYAEAWVRVLTILLPRDPAARYVAGIVEALKYPTTAGPATDALLDALHDRSPDAPGHEAGLAKSLAWIRTAFPSIDVASPAVCPPPLWPDLACPTLAQDR